MASRHDAILEPPTSGYASRVQLGYRRATPRRWSHPVALLPALTIALFAATACRSEKRQEPPPPATSVTTRANADAKAPEPPRRVTILKADIEALVETWRAAQTRGDFDAYSTAYHPLFQGTKRVGDWSKRYDRSAWLADRRGLFRWDIRVLVRDLRIATGEKTAFAIFTQEWSTPTFRDVGPKRLEFKLETSGLLITGEEMLESRVTGAPANDLPAAEELAILFPWKDAHYAVLAQGPVTGAGPARRVPPEDVYEHLVEKDVAPASIPKWKGLLGRAMTLYAGESATCTGRITGFRALGGVYGGDPVSDGTPNEQRAEALWAWLPDSAKHLVAVIEPERAGCEAEWARASDLPASTILPRRDLTPSELERLRSELKRTETAKETERAFDLYKAERKPWNNEPVPQSWFDFEPREWTTSAFVEPDGGATFVAGELFVGDTCDRFRSYVLGIFKAGGPSWVDLTGNGDPTDLFALRPLAGVGPRVAVTLRQGARPYLIGNGVLYRAGRRGFVPVLTASLFRTICSC